MNGTTPSVRGQGLVEYALILLLVALVVIAALALFGQSTLDLYNTIVGSV